MKKMICVLIVVIVMVNCISASDAFITNYSSDEAGFNSAIAGLTTSLINFDDLNLGDIIYDQYNPPVRFLTNEGCNIVANSESWGTSPHSGLLCAQLPHDPPEYTFGELQFDQLEQGVSLWVLDARSSDSLNISVFGENDVLLTQFSTGSNGSYTYVAVLSDSREIACVRVNAVVSYDGIGFDDIIVATPEPATIILLTLGGLVLRRNRK